MIFKDARFFSSWLCISKPTKVSFAVFCIWYAHLSDYFYLISLTYCLFPDFSVFVLFKASSAGLDPSRLFELLTPGTMLPRSERRKVLNYPVCLEVCLYTTLASGKWGREGDENWTWALSLGLLLHLWYLRTQKILLFDFLLFLSFLKKLTML